MEPSNPNRGEVTQLLKQMGSGDAEAIKRLFPIVYDELRRVAANLVRRERPHHTLQATALVNEAYLRLAASPGMTLQNRGHFFAVASRVMRQALVEHARVKLAQKRGGGQTRAEMDDAIAAVDLDLDQVIAVDEALHKLEALDARQAQMLEMQYFIGNSIEEITAATGVPERTVKRELQTGRMFLAEQLHAKGLKLK